MKTLSILKILAIIALLFIGNYFFNHVTAWGGVLLILFGCALSVYFIIKSFNHKNNEKD